MTMKGPTTIEVRGCVFVCELLGKEKPPKSTSMPASQSTTQRISHLLYFLSNLKKRFIVPHNDIIAESDGIMTSWRPFCNHFIS